MSQTVGLPDPVICKTRHAYADFWECLVNYEEHAYRCAYIIGMNSRHFCMHHSFREFAAEKGLPGEAFNGM